MRVHSPLSTKVNVYKYDSREVPYPAPAWPIDTRVGGPSLSRIRQGAAKRLQEDMLPFHILGTV